MLNKKKYQELIDKTDLLIDLVKKVDEKVSNLEGLNIEVNELRASISSDESEYHKELSSNMFKS